MKVTFAIRYHANEGEALYLSLDEYYGSEINEHYDLALEEKEKGLWTITKDFFGDISSSLCYLYEVRSTESGEVLRREPHIFRRDINLWETEHLYCQDFWIERPKYSLLYRHPLFAYPEEGEWLDENYLPLDKSLMTIAFKAFLPYIGDEWAVFVMGEGEIFGNWQKERAIELNYRNRECWKGIVQCPKEFFKDRKSLAFKFVLMNKDRQEVIWEEGENRIIDCRLAERYDRIALDGQVPNFPDELLERHKFAGVVIPLFSLRSKRDAGIGDFGSLKLALEWAKKSKMRMLQLLPINDTTFYCDWRDSYPYNAISVQALHPIYADLNALAPIENKQKKKLFNDEIRRLHKLDYVDYPAVLALKEAYLRQSYEEQAKTLQEDTYFQEFLERERYWLKPYVAFCLLRDKVYPQQMPKEWKGYEQYDEKVVDELFNKFGQREWQYYAYVQYILSEQLGYARQEIADVHLKGDIPIGVAPHSVDVWAEPHLFNTDMSAGAPPDAFAENGQNWGFPTYNWARMKEDGYAWWQNRLGYLGNFFSAYRIDHILGFFRIWEVPRSEELALLGHFTPSLPLAQGYWEEQFPNKFFEEMKAEALVQDPYQEACYHPRIAFEKSDAFRSWDKVEQERWLAIKQDYFYVRHNNLWRSVAKDRLEALLQQDYLLPCAEDLGMLSDAVPQVLNELGILSLDLERMPKTLAQGKWAKVQDLPYFSICTTSTHDMPSLRGWWQGLSDEEKESYIKFVLEENPTLIEDKAKLFSAIIRNHLRASSMGVVLPLADWCSIVPKLSKQSPEEEQINHPDNPNQKWNYRMPFAIDSEAKDLLSWQKQLAQMIEEAGRA